MVDIYSEGIDYKATGEKTFYVHLFTVDLLDN